MAAIRRTSERRTEERRGMDGLPELGGRGGNPSQRPLAQRETRKTRTKAAITRNAVSGEWKAAPGGRVVGHAGRALRLAPARAAGGGGGTTWRLISTERHLPRSPGGRVVTRFGAR